MKKCSIVWVLGAILWIAVGGQAEQHPVFYDCALGRTTTLVITSLTDGNATTDYALRIHDAYGVLLHESTGGLAPNESVALHLASLLGEHDPDVVFGLAVVESQGPVGVSAWYREDGYWTTVETAEPWDRDGAHPDAGAYWYYLQFAETDSRSSGFYLINPGDRLAMVTVTLRNADGKALAVESLPIQGWETWYFLGDDLVYPDTLDEEVWGILDVRSPRPLILVGEYYDAEGWLIDLDISTQAYRIEMP